MGGKIVRRSGSSLSTESSLLGEGSVAADDVDATPRFLMIIVSR